MARGRRKDPENGTTDGEIQPKKRRVQEQENRESTPAPDENDPETQQNMEPTEETENVDTEDLLSMEIPDKPATTMSTDPTAPRLVITKIVVENFKSYYGKQTLGPFHKNFTSILGPNGSGKSNVIDSLLFVFGFRANKLRSKKISVLIHNSSGHPNVKSCSVVVHFAKIIDRGTSCEIQGGSEFRISRSATKSGSSTYHINGRPSTTGEVRNKLKANGIDLDHNRFLILQGEVEQISLMKPKRGERSEEDGMLEYLEDIIGSSRLKVPLDKFKKKIDKLVTIEDTTQQRLNFAENDVNKLIKPVREVIMLMRVENTITKTRHKIFSIDRQEVFEQSEVARKEVEAQKETHCEAEKKLSECNEEIKKLQKEKADLTKQVDESNFKEEIYAIDKKRQECEMTKRDKVNEINQNEKRQEKREHEIVKDKKKLTEAEAAPEKAESNIKEYQEEIDRLKIEIAEYEEKLKELNSQEREANKNNRTELGSIMPQITNLSTEENEWVRKISLANDNLERLVAAANDPQKKLEVAENRAKEVQSTLEKQQTDLANLEKKVPELARKIRENEMSQSNKRRQEHEMQTRMNDMRQQIESGRREAANNGNSAALNALMIEKRNDRIRGIYGRLGDLGGIDEAYDVAISTCCPQLDNIVVDTVETAQECVEFVRHNGLGRANFIALDKQQHLWNQIRNKPQTPEDAPRFIDLITTTDENVRPAFFSVLRNTLFAQTIDDATRISNTPVDGISRWRVATKNGELVETSGTMTGGGKKVLKGRMGKRARVDTSQPTTTEHDLERMEKEVATLRTQLNELRSELSNSMDQLRNQRDEYSKLEHDQRIYAASIPKILEQLERANQEVVKFKTAADSTQIDESQIDEMKEKIKEFEEKKEAVCKRASALRKQKEDLDAKIESVETKILGKTRDQLKKLKKSQAKAEDECKKERLILKNSSNSIDKIKRSIKNGEDAITKSKDELARLKADLNRLEDKVKSHADKKVDYERRLNETTAEIQQITTTLEERTKFVEDIRKTIEEQRRDLAAAEHKLKSLWEKMNEIETNIGKLSLFTLRAGIKLPDMPSMQPSVTAQELEANNEQAEAQSNGDQQDQSIMEVDNNEAGDDQMEIDAHTEELPVNVTAVSIPDTDITIDPAYDRGSLPTLNPEEVRRLNRDELIEKLESYKKKKERCPGKMNLDLIEEYAENTERRDSVLTEMKKLKDFLEEHRKKHRVLNQMRHDEFNEGFQKICIATQEIYQMITLGGDATLEKVNSMETFKEGISFQVRPPKKTWKQITNLSGGEKTLASLALVFGLHNFRPTPLYVMDEIDAALDYRNVSIISTYLKERTKNAQFIVISLRNNMFENGDRLLGIFKTNDCTHNVIYDTENMDGDETDDEE